MSKAIFIGSCVVDVIIQIDHLPKREEDLSILNQTMQLGGCAYNASDCFSHFKKPYQLLCPVGQGAYGDFVRKKLKEKQVEIVLEAQADNGCCYCFVEKDGERTFLSYHGAEYLFEKEWFEHIDTNYDDVIYVSGLEIEEKTGDIIIDFLSKAKASRILFAPGPRIKNISNKRWHDLMALHPIIHLNEKEVMAITQASNKYEACKALYKQSLAPIIVTLGSHGSMCYDGLNFIEVATSPCLNIVDTIGAGDNHAGICVLGLTEGYSWRKILDIANRYAKMVLSVQGGQLNTQKFREFQKEELKNDSYSF